MSDTDRIEDVHRSIGRLEGKMDASDIRAKEDRDRLFLMISSINSQLSSLTAIPDEMARHEQRDIDRFAEVNRRVDSASAELVAFTAAANISKGKRLAREAMRIAASSLVATCAAVAAAYSAWHVK